MKTPLIAAIALVAALALSGCGDDVDDSAAAGAGERVAAGSTAEEPEAPIEAPETGAPTDAELQLVTYLRGDTILFGGDVFTDGELIAAGNKACEMLAEGIDFETMDVLTGDEEALATAGLAPNRNDRDVAAIASQTICTQYDVTQ